MTAKRALITGITGQDGSYLAELLLSKGYEVHGILRRSSSFNTGRIEHLYQDPHVPAPRLHLHYGDLLDASVLSRVLVKVQPDEVYNLGAQTHVRVSFDIPVHTGDVTALGTTRLLEAIRDCQLHPRFYQASSSEIFGNAPSPQSETTPFRPCSPYAVAKLYSYWMTVNYREAYGLYACNGILFNHESPRRGETFVTRKVTRAAARIALGRQDKPDDYVIATGECHSVRELLAAAFGHLGLDWQRHVEVDKRYYRPAEVHELRGDMSKAKRQLRWQPKVGFEELVRMMVDFDLEDLKSDEQGTRARRTQRT